MSELQKNNPANDPVMVAGVTIYISTIIVGVLILISGGLLNFDAWQTVTYDDTGKITSRMHDPTGVLRNLGLFAFGILAFGLAAWRTITAHRQAETANKQLALASRGEIADRFQKGVEMLDNDEEPVRMAGVLIVRDACLEAPASYLRAGIDILSAFIPPRTNAASKVELEGLNDLPKDIDAALRALSRMLRLTEAFFPGEKVFADISKADFRGYTIGKVDFFKFGFYNCVFSSSGMLGSTFENSHVYLCEFKDAGMRKSDIKSTTFFKCDFEFASFHQVSTDIGSKFTKCNFTDCEFNDSDFRGEFSECNISGIEHKNFLFTPSESSSFIVSSDRPSSNELPVDSDLVRTV
ncbi:hypothetical protein [Mesorhizobium sp. KR2-14]|uniref:pentapeptide repeat-containing protein n=1 Tax=Mesorhizobium sp. KR2-14 TaxID=3156610 RepID=UPI0032B53F58